MKYSWVPKRNSGGGSAEGSGSSGSPGEGLPQELVLSRTDAVYYYVHDYLGSIAATLDNRGEFVFAEQVYPYGEIKQKYEAGTATQQRFDFTGKERDAETGLHYHGARYYDSKLGIWLSVDPLLDDYPGLSPYNYCMNNPLVHVDPDGNSPWLVGAALGAALDYATQVTVNRIQGKSWGESLTKVNTASILVSAASGAVGAGLATKISTLGKAAQLGANAIINGGSNVASQVVKTGKVNLVETGAAVVSGEFIGRVAGKVAAATGSAKEATKQLTKASRLAAANSRTGRQLQKEAAKLKLDNILYVQPANWSNGITTAANTTNEILTKKKNNE